MSVGRGDPLGAGGLLEWPELRHELAHQSLEGQGVAKPFLQLEPLLRNLIDGAARVGDGRKPCAVAVRRKSPGSAE